MKLRKVLLYIFLGFTSGVMFLAVLDKMSSRIGNFGGEIFFLPCAVLLVWFGWTIRSQFDLLKTGERKKRDDK